MRWLGPSRPASDMTRRALDCMMKLNTNEMRGMSSFSPNIKRYVNMAEENKIIGDNSMIERFPNPSPGGTPGTESDCRDGFRTNYQ